MSMNSMMISVLVFFTVLCAVWVFFKNSGTASSGGGTSAKLPFLFRMFGGGIFFFAAEAGSLLEGAFPAYSMKIKETLAKADLPLEVKDMYGAKLFFLFLGMALGAFLSFGIPVSAAMRLVCIALFGAIGFLFPGMYLQKLAEKRTDEILSNLPFAIDLISSSMNAGLDFGAAVRYLLSTGEQDVLRKEFRLFLQEVELGKNRTDALKDMQKRICVTEFTRFVSAIAYGMDSGSSIIDIMRIQAEEMRRVRYTRAEQEAAKAPTKMIVPMAIFIFPSMFIMIFTPIFLRVKESGILSLIGK